MNSVGDKMTKLVHGGDIYSAMHELGKKPEELIDFSANINPLGIPKGVEKALIEGIRGCIHYPDPLCRRLVDKLSRHEGVLGKHILCGNGAAELIYRLIQVKKPKKALLLAPTFAEYELALRTIDTQIVYYTLRPEFGFRVQQDYLDYLTEDIDMIVLCNPNNPTGELISGGLLEAIIQKCEMQKTMCLVDECFNDFLDHPIEHSLVDRLSDFKMLTILKAFTKIYAIPGVRLGYILSSQEALIEQMREAGQCWSVSVLAQYAGEAALEEVDYLKATKQFIKEERQYLIGELRRVGFTVYGSHANYIFFKTPTDIQLDQHLYEKGIMIRSCSNYIGLDRCYYRIAVKNHEQNQKLIQEIERILNHGEIINDSRNYL